MDSTNKVVGSTGSSSNEPNWKLKSVVTVALTLLTSSQSILIVWSKRAGKYEYSVTTANFSVEALKCALSLATLFRIWKIEGVTENNRLSTSFDEVIVYPIPAALYLIKNLLQYYIFAYVDAPTYQILKNLNIITTGILYHLILNKKLSIIQWAAFILLCAGCTTAQLNSSSDHVLQTPLPGWLIAVVMALLSGFASVYTEAIIKKRPSRNIYVQNFWLYIFGMLFSIIAIFFQDFEAVVNNGFFHGYSFITVCMILNHALSGIAVSMVMKFADNIVKVYATSVAMLLTGIISVFLFRFNLSLTFIVGTMVVSVSVYLHSFGHKYDAKLQAMLSQIRTEPFRLINNECYAPESNWSLKRNLGLFGAIFNRGFLMVLMELSWIMELQLLDMDQARVKTTSLLRIHGAPSGEKRVILG